jgi:hypothetical protein
MAQSETFYYIFHLCKSLCIRRKTNLNPYINICSFFKFCLVILVYKRVGAGPELPYKFFTRSKSRQSRQSRLKMLQLRKVGTVARDFRPRFFHPSNPTRPLTNGLKPFRIWLRICRDIRFESRQIR